MLNCLIGIINSDNMTILNVINRMQLTRCIYLQNNGNANVFMFHYLQPKIIKIT